MFYFYKWQTKEGELNEKIQVLENQLQEERSARKELELLIEKKAFSIKTVKDNDNLLRLSVSKNQTKSEISGKNVKIQICSNSGY